MTMRWAAAAVLAASAAAAQPAPPQSAGVCVPRALLDRIASYAGQRPWIEVAPIMEALRDVARAPVLCEPPPRPDPPPG